MLLDIAADLPTVSARHHHVEQYESRFDFLECLERIVAVVGDSDRISARLQIIADDVRVIRVVVNDEDRRVSGFSHKQSSEMMVSPLAGQFASQPQGPATRRIARMPRLTIIGTG